jgi:hypothetical protein
MNGPRQKKRMRRRRGIEDHESRRAQDTRKFLYLRALRAFWRLNPRPPASPKPRISQEGLISLSSHPRSLPRH